MMRRPFVLSGGGARGFAHIGVLKAFAEFDIYPEAVSATSAGAIVGALTACGYTANEIVELANNKKFFTLFSKSLYRSLKLSAQPISEFLQKHLTCKTFDQLKVPLFVTATSLITGRQEVFDKGEIIPAVMAACAVPFVYPSVTINNIPYADGGMSGNLPVEPLVFNKYKNIIAVYTNPLPPYNEKAGLNESIDRMAHLFIQENVTRSKEKCTVFIEPPNLANYRMFEEKKKQQIIDEGYNYTRGFLQSNPGAINGNQKQ